MGYLDTIREGYEDIIDVATGETDAGDGGAVPSGDMGGGDYMPTDMGGGYYPSDGGYPDVYDTPGKLDPGSVVSVEDVAGVLSGLPLDMLIRALQMLPIAYEIYRELRDALGGTDGVPLLADITEGDAAYYAQTLAEESPTTYKAVQLARQGVRAPFGLDKDTFLAWAAIQVYLSGTYVAPYGCSADQHCAMREQDHHVMRQVTGGTRSDGRRARTRG